MCDRILFKDFYEFANYIIAKKSSFGSLLFSSKKINHVMIMKEQYVGKILIVVQNNERNY
jgi:hypothetical protein